MHRSIEYGMSVLCGAFVGALLSNALMASFWWVGALAGGLFGYLAVDIRQIFTVFMQAWRAVYGWRPGLEFCGNVCTWFIGIFMGVFTIEVMMFGGMTLFLTVKEQTLAGFLVSNTIMSVAVLCGAIAFATNGYGVSWKGIFLASPVGFFFVVVPYLVFQLYRAMPRVWQFIKTFFFLVHSHKRMLAAADCMLAVAIAQFIAPSAERLLVAAVLGFAIGIAHFEIISVRLLRVVPNGNRVS